LAALHSKRCKLYGYAASFGALPDLQSTSSSVTDTVQELKSHTLWLKEHLARAQNKMKLQADRNRTDREFQVGEQVLLKLQPYAQSSVVNRPCPKLALKYFGPFTVEAKIGRAAYRLDLPDHSQIHPVFHVSQLKPFLPNYTPVFSELPKIAELDAHDLKPNAILERRLVKKGAKAIPQALIKWSTLPETMATWEDWYVLQQCFPELLAGGPANSGGGEDVTTGGLRHGEDAQ